MATRIPVELSQWVAQTFPEFPHVHWGASGALLLHDALLGEARKRIVMPSFTCTSLPSMAIAAGMQVVLVDVDPKTLLMLADQLEAALAEGPDSDTVLLVDHTFGYPDPRISEIRRKHPGLLIIEDCVRALGSRVQGRPVGHDGDWTLISLYKTTPGTGHGALLLTRTPYSIRTGPAPKASLRMKISTFGPFRFVYERLKRRRPEFGATRRDVDAGDWQPDLGVPNDLCFNRFTKSIRRFERDRERRREAESRIRAALAKVEIVRPIDPAPGCETSAYFVTFTVAPNVDRNRLLTDLHRQGLFLMRTWDSIPAFHRPLRSGLKFGGAGSIFLADHIGHIPVDRFRSPKQIAHLIASLRAAAPTSV